MNVAKTGSISVGTVETSSPAGVLVASGTFTKSTSTGNQTINGVGFQPKALLFFWTRQTSFDWIQNMSFGMGFATNYGGQYQNYGHTIASDDNLDTPEAGTRRSQTYSIIIVTNANMSLGAQARVVEFTSTGFIINWQTNENHQDIIHYYALGGSDITHARAGFFEVTTSGGNQSVTGVGFQPDFLMLMWSMQYYEVLYPYPFDVGLNQAILGIGFGKNSGQQGAVYNYVRESGITRALTFGIQRNDLIFMTLNISRFTDSLASLASMDVGGFTLNKLDPPARNKPCMYLALKGGQYAVGDFNSRTTMGIQDVTSVGFQPKGVFLATRTKPNSTGYTNTAELAIGLANSSSFMGGTWYEDVHYADPTNNAMQTYNASILNWRNPTNSTNFNSAASANFVQFLSNGFQLNWTKAESTPKHILYFAIGDGAQEPGIMVNVTVNAVSPADGGSTNPFAGLYQVSENSFFQISATPASGYVFDHWELEGANVGSANPYSFNVGTSSHSIGAFFTLIPAVQVDSCDSLTNWIPTWATLSIDNTDFKEGTGAIVVTPASPLRWYSYARLQKPMDFSGFSALQIWIKVSDATKPVQLMVATDWSNYNMYTITGLTSNAWTHVTVNLSTPTSRTGVINFSSIRFISFSYQIRGTAATLRIDDIQVVNV